MNEYGIFGEQDIIKLLPTMLDGEDLKKNLESIPLFNENIRNLCQASRLMALNDIYKIYIPNTMSVEIYTKLYLAMLRAIQKKASKNAIRQQNINKINPSAEGIIGGGDSFSILGTSGIGKSSAIGKAVDLISSKGIIELDNPYMRLIPTILVQCPFDCSVKSLLLEILRAVDTILDTNYLEKAIKAKSTIDLLIGTVSQVLINHVAVLIIDEIQNTVFNKAGSQLIGILTQLINSAGISICFIGTPEVKPFFKSADYLARRTLGLEYSAFEYNEYFKNFCEILFEYQYTKNKVNLTEEIIQWLYSHSSGTLSLTVSIYHDCQEIAILNGIEEINLAVLNLAFQQRMGMMQGFINPGIVKKPKIKKEKAFTVDTFIENNEEAVSIAELAKKSKEEGIDILILLKEHKITVEEVRTK